MRQQLKLFLGFVFLLFGFSYINRFGVFEEGINLVKYYNSYFKCLIYLGTFFLATGGITLLLASAPKVIKYVLILLTSITVCIEYVFQQTTASNINTDDFSILINASEHIATYLFSTVQLWLPPLCLGVVILSMLSWWLNVEKNKKAICYWGSGMLLLATIFAFNILQKSNGVRTSYPSLIKVPLLYYYAQDNGLYNGKRELVNNEVIVNKGIDHIVMIVDESVRGDLLSINGNEVKNTPFLNTLKDSTLLNYGVATSAAVCSDYSNILLMTGVSIDELPDKNQACRRKPTVFQYAKSAGYNTAFIDCQSTGNRPDGFMTYDDYNYIDNYVQVKKEKAQIEDYFRDIAGIKYLKNNVENNLKSFTYIVKYGSHFPYETTYPKDSTKWSPTASIIDWNFSKKQEVLNNYHNSLKWAVDDYFKAISQSFSKEDSILIIYTSDHGQNIMDDEDITITHCYKGEAPEVMASVPMFMFSTNYNLLQQVKDRRSTNDLFNSVSHFNIFETVTALMGFDNAESDWSLFVKNPRLDSDYVSGDIFGRNKMYKNKREARSE